MTVYFAQREDGMIKIGFTEQPIMARVNGLKVEHKMAFRVLGIIPGTRDDEADLHRRFCRHGAGREMFIPHHCLTEFIENNTFAASDDVNTTKDLRFKASFEKLVSIVGSPQEVARRFTNCNQLYNWWRIPSYFVFRIERELCGQITRHEMRPDLFGDAP